MNTFNRILAISALLAASAATAGAQGYLMTGADGKTASPRWREFLDEQNACNAPITAQPYVIAPAVGYQVVPDDGVVASPRYREFLNEENAQIDAQQQIPDVAAEGSVGYQPTGNDGITASPRYREFLNEREGAQPPY